MGRSKYKLTDEQKQLLDGIANGLIEDMDRRLEEYPELDVYNSSDGKFDNNKFTAIVWYIGEKLSIY